MDPKVWEEYKNRRAPKKIERISFGLPQLDIATGGMKRGTCISISESYPVSGKSLLALHVSAWTTRWGGTVAYLDTESHFPIDLFTRLGTNTNNLALLNTQGPDTDDVLCKIAGKTDLIVIDSMTSWGDEGNSRVFWRKALRTLVNSTIDLPSAERPVILIIHQLRWAPKLGYQPAGGPRLDAYDSCRLVLGPEGTLIRKSLPVGQKIGIEIEIPGEPQKLQKKYFGLYYQIGYCAIIDLIQAGLSKKILTKEGNYYKYKDNLFGPGIDNARAQLTAKELVVSDILKDLEILLPGYPKRLEKI